MSYAELPIERVGVVDGLALDLDNYRIPTRPGDEAAALNYLFAEEDVLSAAKLILRDGYFDNEVPIVVRDGAACVVLEGNRRVSALKGLLDPGIVPSHEHELRGLLKRYAVEAEDLPTVIRVLLAPSREAANPHIARLHTTVPKKRWSRDQQANYYHSLLGPTTTVDDVKADYPDVDVVRFIKMVGMRRFLAGVNYADASLGDYVAGADLTMSVFEYAYRNADIAYAMGVTFDRDGHLQPATRRPEAIGASLTDRQRAAVEYLMGEFRAKRLNTRSEEFKKDKFAHGSLLAKLAGVSSASDGAGDPPSGGGPEDDGPDVGGDGPPNSGGSSDAGGGPDGDGHGLDDSTDGPTPRGPNHPDTKTTLALSGLDYTHTSRNLQLRYFELRKISLKDNPVAATLLLRSVLETTIKFHFEGTSTPASGELTTVFKVVVAAYGGEKALRHCIGQIRSGGTGTPGSATWFNLVSHSADLVVDADQVRKAFQLIEPVLRRLLLPAADPTT